MKKRITKIVGVVLSLALLSSLAMVAPVSAVADPDVLNDWEKIVLPPVTEDGTDVELLAVAADGTLFASIYDNDADTDEWWSIYKSTNGGWTWSKTKFKDYGFEITAIVCDPSWDPDQNRDTLYVGTMDGQVFRCTDAGSAEPVLLRQIVDSTTAQATVVYDMDLWTDGGNIFIMVATDIDVLVMEDSLFAEWIDMDLSISFDGFHTSYDGTDQDFFDPRPMTVGPNISAALVSRFAPDFDQSGLIWSIIRDDNGDAWITATISPGQWGQIVNSVEIQNDGLVRHEIDMDFAEFYTSTSAPIVFAALNADNSDPAGDDLYLIEGGFDVDSSIATPLEVDGGGIDFQSIQVSGEVILGGEYTGFPDDNNANVWISRNGGDTFNEAIKPPSGERETQVLMAPGAFDPDTGVAYAATRGDESAFSYTMDGGATWNQTAFVDTDIDNILDITFGSPTILLTDDWGGPESIWRTVDIGAEKPRWERVYNDDQSDLWGFRLVEYAMEDETLMLFGRDGGNSVIEKSLDYGQTWNHWRTLPDPVGEIVDWVVYDGATIYAACENGYYGTTRFGPAKQRFETNTTPAQSLGGLVSITVQPGFDPNDPDNATVLIGNDGGKAFVSDDGGNTWGSGATVGAGDVLVAFDSDGTAYFATSLSTVKKGTISGNKITGSSIKTLKDSTGVAVSADTINGLWIAPDDALYVMAADTTPGAITNDYNADGTVNLVGANVTVTGTIAVQCPSEETSTDLVLTDKDITVISGAFADGELVSIIEYNLVCEFVYWELTSSFFGFGDWTGWGQITGLIGVQGVNSGATGKIVIDPAQYGVTVEGYEIACFSASEYIYTIGSFESGGLNGWTVGGLGASVEVLNGGNFSAGFPTTDGSDFAFLSNGPGMVNPADDIDIDGSNYLNSDTVTLSRTFTIDAPATLTFDWLFGTSEQTQLAMFDDIFHATLNGAVILSGSVDIIAGDTSPYPNVTTDYISNTVTSGGPTNGTVLVDGISWPFTPFTLAIPAAGTYTLEFLVSDNGNHIFDSGLMVDNIRLDGALLQTQPAIPSSSPVVLISSFLEADVTEASIVISDEALSGVFADLETLNIIDCSLLGNATGGVTGSITVQGATSLEIDSIAIDIATDLGFEDGEVVNCASSTLDVDAIGIPGSSTTNEALLRLLLHEPKPMDGLGNVWEIVPIGDAEGLWGSNSYNTLWTVVSNDELWALEDSLSGPVQGVTVSSIGETKATISWAAVAGGEDTSGDDNDIVYYVHIAMVVAGVDIPYSWIETKKTSVLVMSLLDNKNYKAMVRVHPQPDSVYSSRWSTAASFTTIEAIAKPCSLGEMVPYNGMQDAPLLASFVWPEVPNAVEYEFQLSTDPGMATLLVDITTANNAYTLTTELAYDTNHYWQVRAVSDTGTKSAWCFSNFHTRTEAIPPVTIEPPPTPTIILPTPQVTVIPPDIDITLPAPSVTVIPPDITVAVPPVVTVTQLPVPTLTLPVTEDPGTPAYIWVIVGIGALLTIAVIVLIIRTRRVV